MGTAVSCWLLLAGMFYMSPDRPSTAVFVVGDSISIQYGPYLEKYLGGSFHYDRKRDAGGASADLGVPAGENGGDSRMVLEYLSARQRGGSFAPDILLVNCGLHDIKRDLGGGKSLQVPPEDYRSHLKGIYALSRNIGARLVWVTTTPVVNEIHNSRSLRFHRYAEDLEVYNEIAEDVFRGLGVPIIDLYTFTRTLGNGAFVDHVHYDESTRALQAAYIAGFLTMMLEIEHLRSR